MTDNIVKLTDRLLPGEVNSDLVEALERLLEQVKAGEIIGLSWAGARADDSIMTGWDGAGGTMWKMNAAITVLQARFANMMLEDEE